MRSPPRRKSARHGGVTSDGYTPRAATEADWDGLADLLSLAFNDDWDDTVRAVERIVFEPDRALVVDRGDRIVGTAGIFTRDLTVPGAVLPSAHVTMVGVAPDHRRRGLLSTMMARLLTQAGQAGEPVAHLWASEGAIYQRYGYGMAAQRAAIDAPREVQLRQPPPAGAVRQVPLDAGTPPELPPVYERVRAGRPGWSSRDARWWRRILADPKTLRHGATALRATVHDGPDGPDGYALWRVRNDHTGGPGAVEIKELVAGTLPAYLGLWHFLLNVDLTRSCRYWLGAADEPLLYLVDHPRQLNQRVGDSLWLRLVDLPAALAGRRYAADVDVTLAVTDPLLPGNTGTWHLVGGPESASCTRTGRPAQLRADIGALGAAYLGGAALGVLAAAGRVTELDPGALMRAGPAFGWHRAPSAIEVF